MERSEHMVKQQNMAQVTAGGVFSIVPASVIAGGSARSPSDRMGIAVVGVGGQAPEPYYWAGRGSQLVEAVADDEHIAALCDVDERYARATFETYPDATKYRDYRRMLDEMEDQIEGVMIATPDHTHAVVTAAAMKRGMHVYTEKPLTHTVWEARRLRELARETGVTTQMGNHGHSEDSVRRCRELVEAGGVGTVQEVHCWTSAPTWPQGEVKTPRKPGPEGLEWNLWLGPAEKRPYSPAYHPVTWRGFRDFGSGAIGDMGCHVMDMPFYALQLPPPVRIEASTSTLHGEAYPEHAVVRYQFPSVNGNPGIRLNWYSGGLKPPLSEHVPSETRLGGHGCMLVGDRGTMVTSNYGRDARIYPLSRMESLKDAPETYPRVKKSHPLAWIEAAREGDQPASSFDYAGCLTETVLLGSAAIRARKPLCWDAENLEITNVPQTNHLLRTDYRDGWSL